MGAAPVPYAPETSQAPHEGSTVPPLVDEPAEMNAPEDEFGEAEDRRDGQRQPLDRRTSTRSTKTLAGLAGQSTGVAPEGEKRDLEKGAGGEVEGEEVDGQDDKSNADVIVVDWKGKDDPACPLNWSNARRTGATFCVAAFTLLAPLSSSMIAPAAPQVAEKLHITNEVEISMTVSIFVLAFSISPLLFGPASELFGRVRVLQYSGVFYAIFNLVCAFATTRGQFIAFRFLAGLGGGAPLSIGAGVLADLWRPEERGKSSALYSLGPLLGPAMGPIFGGWIAEKVPNDGYKIVFYATTGFSALVQFIGLFYLKETYGPVLLHRQAQQLKKEMGLPPDSDRVQTVYEAKQGGKRKSTKDVIMHGMLRPFVLFFHEPILQSLACLMSLIYGIIYILIVSTTSVFEGTYGQSVGIASLHFIAMMLGFFLASQVGARALDVIYRKLKAREGGKGRPEFRLPLTFPAVAILPLGLFLYGWGAERQFHWIVPDIGLFLVALAMILVFTGCQSYILDAFSLHAASAIAVGTCLRSILGFAFPLFAPYMYNAIGYGWGCTILALVSIAVGWTAVPLLYVYGERIRLHSKFAAKQK
ncbi:hypothetical protein JCM8547_002057 [Rhodosporidiobolus lusitaniae]